MDASTAVALFYTALFLIPAYFAGLAIIEYLGSNDYWRDNGVVILRAEALDAHGDEIGHYLGTPIWRTVTFKGMLYVYQRIVPAALSGKRRAVGRDELYMAPGIIYRTGLPR